MNKKLKLIIGAIYLFCFMALFYILFTYLDLKDLSSYSYIKTKSQILNDFKSAWGTSLLIHKGLAGKKLDNVLK